MKKHNLRLMTAALVFFGIGAPLLAAEFDDRVESSARKSYIFKTYLKGDDIKIKTTADGIVTLTGTVSEASHRTLATETVAGLPGVKRVDNNLEVAAGQPEENSDAWIATKVKITLMFHRNVSGVETKVDVKDGIVTLHGETASLAQKELTTEYAKDVEGVSDVRNEMVVKNPSKSTAAKNSGEKIDDVSITVQVKMALLFHRSTSAIRVNVDTQNGRVTLSGWARNAAEKDLAGKLAMDIRGVVSVKNEIKIDDGLGKM